MQYIREARYKREGIDGLLQLGAVYTANLQMFGNTLFYPGMQIFINPFDIGLSLNGHSKTTQEQSSTMHHSLQECYTDIFLKVSLVFRLTRL